MESIIVACITGVVTLVGVILSNSKSRARHHLVQHSADSGDI
jgi:hypothetical protein